MARKMCIRDSSNSLAGGESQRINLATSLGSSLVGSLGADGFYTAVRIAGVQDKHCLLYTSDQDDEPHGL